MSRNLKQEQVYNNVLAMVTQQRYAYGEKLPCGLELAEMFGVSHMTMRRTLARLEAEGVIHQIQGKGIFVNRQVEFSRAIAVMNLLHDKHAPWPLPVQNALNEAGYQSTIFDNNFNDASMAYFRFLLTQQCDAFIFDYMGNFTEDIFRELPEGILKINIHSRKRGGYDFPCVSLLCDHRQSGVLAVRALLDNGCRKIAVIGGLPDEPTETNELFNLGVCDELAQHGLKPYIVFRHDVLTDEEKLDVVTKCDGCVALLDSQLLQLIGGCSQQKRIIGKDFMMVGRYNTPWAKKYGLTSVDLNAWQLCQYLPKILRDNISTGSFLIQPDTAFRQSCPAKLP